MGVAGLAKFIGRAGDAAGKGSIVYDPDAEELPVDMRRVEQAARAMEVLLARVPDILAFEERTTEQAGNATDATDDLAASMGVDLAAPPKLRVVGNVADSG
jgi:hypothetical protein